MIYRVTASLRTELAGEFQAKLTDGTIKSQRPDGGEIVDAMNGAVVTEEGETQWSIGCFCRTPLAHERATVFDRYFDDINIQPTARRETYEGAAFMDHLAALARQAHAISA